MRPDRMMWAVGLALAVAVLTGLVLNLVTGLTRLSWAVALAIALVACACAGLVIRRRGGDEVAPAPVPRRGFRLSPVTARIPAARRRSLAGAAVWLAAASADWQHAPGFAQLWLVPADGATATLGVRDNYPGAARRSAWCCAAAGRPSAAWDLALDRRRDLAASRRPGRRHADRHPRRPRPGAHGDVMRRAAWLLALLIALLSAVACAAAAHKQRQRDGWRVAPPRPASTSSGSADRDSTTTCYAANATAACPTRTAGCCSART